jgi:EAL domain-containing protein (putative c-di-GMP-specific phosphodiesterase class I)
MRDAEVALDVAKAAGSGGLVLYSRGMEKDQRKHLDQLTDARTALAAGRIVPFYQPKVSLSTNTVCGFEALLRLADTLGVRPPGSIANALDHPDIGLNIGRAIQSQVFADMKAWRDANLRFGSVAINASPVELLQSAYAHDLLERLHFHSLSPESVQVEVTETAMMGDGSGKIAGELRTLMSSGVMVYLDDFGTGFSSLKHLREFPVKGLKIDRSFVRDVESDAHARAIVRALVQLANSLDLSVVGEGVETQAQAQYLSDEGCTVVQGFLYGKAMPAELVTKLLASKVFERSDH